MSNILCCTYFCSGLVLHNSLRLLRKTPFLALCFQLPAKIGCCHCRSHDLVQAQAAISDRFQQAKHLHFSSESMFTLLQKRLTEPLNGTFRTDRGAAWLPSPGVRKAYPHCKSWMLAPGPALCMCSSSLSSATFSIPSQLPSAKTTIRSFPHVWGNNE